MAGQNRARSKRDTARVAARRRIGLLALLAVGGCGSPGDGDRTTYEGTVERTVECLALRTDGGLVGLFGEKASKLRPGQHVEVTGKFSEASICHIKTVRVERVRVE